MYLLLDLTQFNLNFEPSLVGIHHVLRERCLFEHEFQARNLIPRNWKLAKMLDEFQQTRAQNLS